MTAVLLAILSLCQATPSYLVERVVTVKGEVRRLSVFRDGVSVYVIATPGSEKKVITRQLNSEELIGLLQTLEGSCPDLTNPVANPNALGDAFVELRVAPPGQSPRIIRYPVTAPPMIALGRIIQVLDGIGAALLEGKPVKDDMSLWDPQVGEWLELDDGRVVMVDELMANDTSRFVRIRLGESPVTQVFELEELRRKIIHRVKR